MAVREDRDVSVARPKLGDDAVGALADVGKRLPTGDIATPDGPARPFSPDFDRLEPFVLAVVPLSELVARDCDVPQPGQPTGLRRALERTRQYDRELPLLEHGTDRLGVAPALLGQRNVGATGVLSGAAPLGLPMTDEDDFGRPVEHVSAQGGAQRVTG